MLVVHALDFALSTVSSPFPPSRWWSLSRRCVNIILMQCTYTMHWKGKDCIHSIYISIGWLLHYFQILYDRFGTGVSRAPGLSIGNWLYWLTFRNSWSSTFFVFQDVQEYSKAEEIRGNVTKEKFKTQRFETFEIRNKRAMYKRFSLA